MKLQVIISSKKIITQKTKLMKKQILISLILLSSFFTLNAQWTGTNPIWTNSNTGIGTPTPNGKLHIVGTGSQDLLLQMQELVFLLRMLNGLI